MYLRTAVKCWGTNWFNHHTLSTFFGLFLLTMQACGHEYLQVLIFQNFYKKNHPTSHQKWKNEFETKRKSCTLLPLWRIRWCCSTACECASSSNLFLCDQWDDELSTSLNTACHRESRTSNQSDFQAELPDVQQCCPLHRETKPNKRCTYRFNLFTYYYYRVGQKNGQFFCEHEAFTDWAEILHTFNITYYSFLSKISKLIHSMVSELHLPTLYIVPQ